jgi:hypothetical protein
VSSDILPHRAQEPGQPMTRISNLSSKDLNNAEQACRALAARYREEAKRQTSSLVRDSQIESAQKFEMLADRLKRAREASNSNA